MDVRIADVTQDGLSHGIVYERQVNTIRTSVTNLDSGDVNCLVVLLNGGVVGVDYDFPGLGDESEVLLPVSRSSIRDFTRIVAYWNYLQFGEYDT